MKEKQTRNQYSQFGSNGFGTKEDFQRIFGVQEKNHLALAALITGFRTNLVAKQT